MYPDQPAHTPIAVYDSEITKKAIFIWEFKDSSKRLICRREACMSNARSLQSIMKLLNGDQ